MQQNILFKAQGKPSTRPTIVITGIAIDAMSSTSLSARISRTLSSARNWMRCNCTPRNIVKALFSAKASMAVAIVCLCAMWWHNISIADAIEAQKAIAFDAILAMPWGIAWLIRSSIRHNAQKGGKR